MSLDQRLERLQGRHGRRPDMTTVQLEREQREDEHLDREIEWLLAEVARRGLTDEAARIFPELEADERNRGLGT